MKKPAIIIKPEKISHENLIELIKKCEGNFHPTTNAGLKIKVNSYGKKMFVVIFKNGNGNLANSFVVGIKENVIFTSEMLGFFTDILLHSKEKFRYQREMEVPKKLERLVQNTKI